MNFVCCILIIKDVICYCLSKKRFMGYIVYMNCDFYMGDFVICVCFVFV